MSVGEAPSSEEKTSFDISIFLNVSQTIQSKQHVTSSPQPTSRSLPPRVYANTPELWSGNKTPGYLNIQNGQKNTHFDSYNINKNSWCVNPRIRSFTEFDLKRSNLTTDHSYIKIDNTTEKDNDDDRACESKKDRLTYRNHGDDDDIECDIDDDEKHLLVPSFDSKRCSLFTDQGYVKMHTLEQFEFQSSNSGPWGSNKDTTRRNIAFTELDTKRSSLFSDQGYVHMEMLQRAGIPFSGYLSDNISVCSSTNSEDLTLSCCSKESVGRYVPFTTSLSSDKRFRSVDILIDDNDETSNDQGINVKYPLGSKYMTLNTPRKPVTTKAGKHNTWNFRKPVSLYDRLMKEMKEQFTDDDSVMQLSETELVDELDFNPIEGRIIYHTVRGWTPNISFTHEGSWKEKFPVDFTVNELYLYVARQGNSRLAEYLRKYHVDGYFMVELLKDDLLLDERLFDENFLSANELKNIRQGFFPKRPRCNALVGHGGSSVFTL